MYKKKVIETAKNDRSSGIRQPSVSMKIKPNDAGANTGIRQPVPSSKSGKKK